MLKGGAWVIIPAQLGLASRLPTGPNLVHMFKHDAVVSGPDGLSGFEELRRRRATRSTILYAVDLVGTMGRICAIVRTRVRDNSL